MAVNKFSNTVSILKNISIVQNIRLLNNLLDFGIIKSNQSKSLTFQIMNEAALNPLIISNITSSTPSVFSVTPTSAIINALDTLTVKVTFTSNEVRQYIDSLTILSDDPDEPIVNLFLTGTSAPVVISSTPSRNSVNANDSTDILATFNSPMLQSTIQNSNFFAYGEISGRNSVNISYEGTTSAVTLNPDSNFVIGEKVQVVITEDIKSDPDSIPLVH
ncbi:MAG: DUF1573 domain-containing protein, partial [Aliifodinibius sp.]|nr:DUF1573 domain-containing protein [Nitrosopumilaceae archaeon]NIV09844.1 DUF1573 domain-containing protein [Fodinibius sp.]NIX61815.1 DUF1573 domain-containing protein [Nitrosopumilaceae archaeon]